MFRSLLQRLAKREEVINTPTMRADLVDKFKALLEKYETLEGIPDDFRKDVEQSLIAACDLADTISEPHYAIDEIIHSVVVQQAACNRLLDHARRARPRARGYAIIDLDAKVILSGFFFNSEIEAQAMVAQLSAIAPTKHYTSVQSEISSFYVHQPAVSVFQPPKLPSLPEISINKDATPSWQTPQQTTSTPGLPPLPTISEIDSLEKQSKNLPRFTKEMERR